MNSVYPEQELVVELLMACAEYGVMDGVDLSVVDPEDLETFLERQKALVGECGSDMCSPV
jgi:hypothetical protein